MNFLKTILFSFFSIVSLVNQVQAEDETMVSESFAKAKKILISNVYTDCKRTIYCDAEFTPNKRIIFPEGFDASKVADRSERVEIEHVVPAENFGSMIKQWRDGDPLCVDKKNKPYKGRKCAEKTSRLYRVMQADLYNLYPAIGSVNAVRSNYDFTEFPQSVPALFGSCAVKFADDQVEVPDAAKGIVARAYLYFDSQYNPIFELSDEKRQQMEEWNALYPVTSWECVRTYRIEKIQKNKNMIVREGCERAGLWPQEKYKKYNKKRKKK